MPVFDAPGRPVAEQNPVVIELAARLLARFAGALNRHARGADGRCDGCGGAVRTPWPCVHVLIADRAATIRLRAAIGHQPHGATSGPRSARCASTRPA